MASTLYPVNVSFTVVHQTGNLAGLEIADSIGFCSRDSAQRWIDAVSKRTDKVFSGFVVA